MLKKLLRFLYISVLFISCTEERSNEISITSNPYYETAFDFRESQQPDSAFVYFMKGKDLFMQESDSFGAAKCLVNMAVILTNQGDYFGAQETSLEALNYLDQHNFSHHHYLGSNYNNLGLASRHLKDYERSLQFYDLAIQFSDDSLDTHIYLNNKALTFRETGKYTEALSIYQAVMSNTIKNPMEYARLLSNIAMVKWLHDPMFDAAPDFHKALHIRSRENDLRGLTTSYFHLSDYYRIRRPDSAAFYADKMYTLAVERKSANDQLLALQRLIRLGPSHLVKPYFETYTQLSDSVYFAHSAAKNQFALIRYEVEKNKADNLRLQNENAEKTYRIHRQRLLNAVVVVLAIVFSVSGVYWYKRRKQRLELEAQNRIKAHQLKTSKKVHDVVANGLYRVMTEIENQTQIDREGILDRLDKMYEKSRDISYETEDQPAKQQDFNEKITCLLTSFATVSTKVIIAGNTADLWQAVDEQARCEVEQILQELMVNMRKHSHASHVVIRFEQQDNELCIYYSDNGVGLPATFQYHNGLTNTGNRIEMLQGQIIFDTTVEKGVKIRLSFPVS